MLAPSPAEITELLTGSLSSLVSLKAWAHAIVNTTLYPLTPAPSWYDGVSTELQNLQKPAQTWIDDNEPTVTAALWQSFVDYGTEFANAAADMVPLLADIRQNSGNTPTAPQLSSLNGYLSSLSSQALAEQSVATSVASAITAFYDSANAARSALTSAIAAAEQTLKTDQSAIAALSSQVSGLQTQLAVVTQEAQQSLQKAGEQAANLSMKVVVYTLTTLAGSAGSLVGIAGAVVSLGIDVAESVENNAEVIDTLKEISNLQAQLRPEEQQVAALQGVISNLEALDTLSLQASNLYTSLLPAIWQSVASELQSVVDELKQPNVDVTFIDGLAQLPQAASSWAAIVNEAMSIQNGSVTLGSTVTLMQPS